jgi:hypothetical protein
MLIAQLLMNATARFEAEIGATSPLVPGQIQSAPGQLLDGNIPRGSSQALVVFGADFHLKGKAALSTALAIIGKVGQMHVHRG